MLVEGKRWRPMHRGRSAWPRQSWGMLPIDRRPRCLDRWGLRQRTGLFLGSSRRRCSRLQTLFKYAENSVVNCLDTSFLPLNKHNSCMQSNLWAFDLSNQNQSKQLNLTEWHFIIRSCSLDKLFGFFFSLFLGSLAFTSFTLCLFTLYVFSIMRRSEMSRGSCVYAGAWQSPLRLSKALSVSEHTGSAGHSRVQYGGNHVSIGMPHEETKLSPATDRLRQLWRILPT